jgi:hypothetical protein
LLLSFCESPSSVFTPKSASICRAFVLSPKDWSSFDVGRAFLNTDEVELSENGSPRQFQPCFPEQPENRQIATATAHAKRLVHMKFRIGQRLLSRIMALSFRKSMKKSSGIFTKKNIFVQSNFRIYPCDGRILPFFFVRLGYAK